MGSPGWPVEVGGGRRFLWGSGMLITGIKCNRCPLLGGVANNDVQDEEGDEIDGEDDVKEVVGIWLVVAVKVSELDGTVVILEPLADNLLDKERERSISVMVRPLGKC